VVPSHNFYLAYEIHAPSTGDFSTSLNRINFIISDLRYLSSKVTQAIDRFGANKAGVYLVAFDEVVPIFIEAQGQLVLSAVKWYGSLHLTISL
jgi:hypothetical protein